MKMVEEYRHLSYLKRNSTKNEEFFFAKQKKMIAKIMQKRKKNERKNDEPVVLVREKWKIIFSRKKPVCLFEEIIFCNWNTFFFSQKWILVTAITKNNHKFLSLFLGIKFRKKSSYPQIRKSVIYHLLKSFILSICAFYSNFLNSYLRLLIATTPPV